MPKPKEPKQPAGAGVEAAVIEHELKWFRWAARLIDLGPQIQEFCKLAEIYPPKPVMVCACSSCGRYDQPCAMLPISADCNSTTSVCLDCRDKWLARLAKEAVALNKDEP